MNLRKLFAIALSAFSLALDPSVRAQPIKADAGSVAIGGNVSNSTINIGILPEQLAALIKQAADLSEAQKKLIADLESKLEINQQQIRAALEILGEANIPQQQQASKLLEVAERFKSLREVAATQPGDQPKVAALKADAQKAIEEGDLAKADILLSEVESAQRLESDRLAVNLANTQARRGEIALTRLKYGEAAEHFSNAAATLPSDDTHQATKIEYLQSEAYALYRQGAVVGDVNALASAVERYRTLVALAPRERDPLEWCKAQVVFATVLVRLAVQQHAQGLPPAAFLPNKDGSLPDPDDFRSKLANIQEALVALQSTFEELSPDRALPDWSRAMVEYGNAQHSLSGALSDFKRFDEAEAADKKAVESLKLVLARITRDSAPALWAEAQSNLADILLTVASRTKDQKLLSEACSANEVLASGFVRERDPLGWANVQLSLADCLSAQATAQNDASLRDLAITKRRAAMEELTPERAALAWAQAQDSLGRDLLKRGVDETGTNSLQEAVVAFSNALDIYKIANGNTMGVTRLLLLHAQRQLELRRDGKTEIPIIFPDPQKRKEPLASETNRRTNTGKGGNSKGGTTTRQKAPIAARKTTM